MYLCKLDNNLLCTCTGFNEIEVCKEENANSENHEVENFWFIFY